MKTLNSLLDKASEMCGSDLAAAARLKVTRSAVSKWRHGGKIAPEQLARLVELTQQDPAIAVQVLQEQEATPAERKLWGALWDRLSPATTTVVGVLALCAIVGLYLSDSTGMAIALLPIMFVAILVAVRLVKARLTPPMPA